MFFGGLRWVWERRRNLQESSKNCRILRPQITVYIFSRQNPKPEHQTLHSKPKDSWPGKDSASGKIGDSPTWPQDLFFFGGGGILGNLQPLRVHVPNNPVPSKGDL